MFVQLTETEVFEAVKEYLAKRGIPADESKMGWSYLANGAGGRIPNGKLRVHADGVTVPPKDGPYR